MLNKQASGSKLSNESAQKTRTVEFVSDIDNFVGLKKIHNYYFTSIVDDGFRFGPTSVGVLQLFNKKENKSITKEDLNRLDHISKFIGALSVKVQYICTSMTLIIGLIQDVHKSRDMMIGIDSTPGSNVFQNLQLPVDSMKKTLLNEMTYNDD